MNDVDRRPRSIESPINDVTMGRKGKGKRYQDEDAAAVVEDVKEEAGDESSDDDDSSKSSASSTSSSEDSPTPSDLNSNGGHHDAPSETTPSKSKTWDSMDGYQVRQNAIKLLNSPDANANETNNGGGVDRKMNSITYKSYHDSPYSSGSQFSSSQTSPYNGSAQPNWGDSRYNANDSGDDNLSVYHIASLTFNCMVHCLTEGYRAASTYYNSSHPEDSAPSHMGGYQPTSSSSFGHVGSYQDNSYNGGSGGQNQEREVMERETSQLKAPGSSGNEDGDWGTTVKLPSTYQGKK
mmetsp:Transcript_5022/g.7292  ORF Transcript_5022/g.7292 Transcript_5022/m.7292 type:complete len:294 (-) Transcript_5022:89-970(-)